MSDGRTDFRKVRKQEVVVSPFISVVSINSTSQICCGTDRNNEANQFSSRRIDQHSFDDSGFASTTGGRHGFFAASCSSVVNGLDDTTMDSAE